MTEGHPWKRIAEFAIPMLIGNIAQQLYNTADSVIVGIYVGDNALSAVGSAMPILNLLLALFVGIATGAGIVISQSFGAKDREGLSTNIGNCISLAGIATIVIMIIGPLVTRPLLSLLDTPPAIFEWCATYLNIFFIGIAGFFFYNMLSGILRGLGDSFSALVFLLISAALNVVLDILFVAKLGMEGVSGVALATVIAQGIFAMSGMVVMSLTNKMGAMVVACNVIIMRVDGFAMMPNMTFGQAMSVYTGQNVGARKLDRVNAGTKQGAAMALAVSGIITIILLFFGKYLFEIFTDTRELIDLAVKMMRILAAGYLCIAITQVLGGVMRGAGDTVTPMWISIISTVLLRVPTAYIVAYFSRTPEFPHGQPYALFLSLLISWVLGMVISIIAFRFGKWKKKMTN